MPEHQTIIVTQNNSNDGGCLSGCGTLLALLLVIGLVVTYWYVAVPVALVAVGIGAWLWTRQPAPTPVAPAPAIPAGPGPLTAADCANCGQPAVGNFCQHCGTAHGRTCADCGHHGLNSPYCPCCGSATYAPPPPTG